MPVEIVHTTIGVSFLAVLAMLSQIVIGHRWEARDRRHEVGIDDRETEG